MIQRRNFIIVFFTSIFFLACNDQQATVQKVPAPVAVETYKAGEEVATYYDSYPATINALNEVQIRAQVSGYITGIYFKDGQKVSRGQKLYTIDQQQYQAGVDQSVANLNVARANLVRAQQDADRYNDLAKKDAIARQVVDHAMADLESAKMQVAAAQANVRSVQTGLRYATIFAPLNGTIGISAVKLGAAVTPGVTILNTVSEDNPMAVDVAIDEKQINYFTLLKQKGTPNKDSVFQLILSDGTIYEQPGQIYLIDRAVDPQTGTIKARLTFANINNALKPGMSCNLRVKNGGSGLQILIPYKAILEQMGEYFVFVVNGNTVSQRKLTLGKRIGDKVIVSNGLQVNEEIATEGIQKLKDGSAIQKSSKTTGATLAK